MNPDHRNKFTLLITLAAFLSLQIPSHAEWVKRPIRSPEEVKLRLEGGECEQFPHCMSRSQANPDYIYFGHDMGQVWVSTNNGVQWQHPKCEGLYTFGANSVISDPADENVILVASGASWDYTAAALQGVYRSKDLGETWDFVLPVEAIRCNQGDGRYEQQTFAFDPTQIGDPDKTTWYFIANKYSDQKKLQMDAELYTSIDGGCTWLSTYSFPRNKFGLQMDLLIHHPTVPGKLWLGCEKGLFSTDDGGKSWIKTETVPAEGRVRTIDINPKDSDDFYISVDDEGIFRTLNGGKSFSQINTPYKEVRRISAHPTDRNLLYLIGDIKHRRSLQTSHDGGKTWIASEIQTRPGKLWSENPWYTMYMGDQSVVLPDPRNVNSAVGQSCAHLFRTENKGKTFTDSSTGFTGYLANNYSFDRHDPKKWHVFFTDTGVLYTQDGGLSYTRSRPDALRKKTPFGVPPEDGYINHMTMLAGDVEPGKNPKVIVASAGGTTRAKLVRRNTGEETWVVVDDRLNWYTFVRFHIQKPNIVYANNLISTDAGKSFKKELKYKIMDMYEKDCDIIYACSGKKGEHLYRSTNAGSTWQRIPIENITAIPFSGKPTFAIDPENPDIFYTTGPGGLYKCSITGQKDKIFDIETMVGKAPQTMNWGGSVVVDPSHPGTMYLGLAATGMKSIFKSTDAGNTWQDISENLPFRGIERINIHPLTGQVFVNPQGLGTWEYISTEEVN